MAEIADAAAQRAREGAAGQAGQSGAARRARHAGEAGKSQRSGAAGQQLWLVDAAGQAERVDALGLADVAGQPWLVVIDMQAIFGDPDSAWFTPDFDAITPAVLSLIEAFGERVVYTRFIAPQAPEGAWQPYYRQWPFALNAGGLNELSAAFSADGHPVVDRPTFGKWGAELDAATRGSREFVLAGVSTDCCVLSTALAAADAGVHVRVAADACAGVSEEDHRRALDAMAMYAPMIEISSAADVLASVAGTSARA